MPSYTHRAHQYAGVKVEDDHYAVSHPPRFSNVNADKFSLEQDVAPSTITRQWSLLITGPI